MIDILSRKQADAVMNQAHGRTNVVMISINDSDNPDPPFDVNSWTVREKFTVLNNDLLVEVFDDIETDSTYPNGKLITYEQAEKIVKFGLRHQHRIRSCWESIWIHCTGGVSRSSAVAAALLTICGSDDWAIFNNGKYCPNRYVYETILKAGGASVPKYLVDEKFNKNLVMWNIEASKRGLI